MSLGQTELLKSTPQLQVAPTSISHNDDIDYSVILDAFGLKYTSIEYYWQVGAIKFTQGWILHLSVVCGQIVELLHLVIPFLIKEAVSFKIIRTQLLANDLMEGQLGARYFGKVICIYPVNNLSAVSLAKRLISLTSSFAGPAILTDQCLGGIVYTRYGSFNPVYRIGPKGRKVKHIYNSEGKLVPDPYNIPFLVDKSIGWPFAEILPFVKPNHIKLFNFKYYPIATIKNDIKGKVFSAIYFKGNALKIRSCIIKEGRKYVLFDDQQRDIRDRLKWQFDLYHKLSADIPFPRVIDYFEQSGNAYLAMDRVHGISFAELLQQSFCERPWFDLEISNQLTIVEYLLRITSIVEKIHSKGFVHRDITPENFLIDKLGQLWLIDVELMFSISEQFPAPPFKLGTTGFMSPQQQRSEIPTEKEDIYALGALMITAFTNLPPTKFSVHWSEMLTTQLIFFIEEVKVTELIADCLRKNPEARPNLKAIKDVLSDYHHQLSSKPLNKFANKKTNDRLADLPQVIQSAISGLGHPFVLSEDCLWFSPMWGEAGEVGNEQTGKVIRPGWHTGLSGIVWLLDIAKANDYDLTHVDNAYRTSFDYLENYCHRYRIEDYSLYSGSAGLALAFTARNSRKEKNSEVEKKLFEKLYSDQELTKFSISEGIAGIGISLLKSIHFWDEESVGNILEKYTKVLTDNQKKDGSWSLPKEYNIKRILSLDHGITGIIWFLLCYLQQYKDEDVTKTVSNGISCLLKIRRKNQRLDKYTVANICLILTKAYTVIGENAYRDIAQEELSAFPRYSVDSDFTLARGLCCLGEIYMDAFHAFGNIEWYKRAACIAQVFLNTSLIWPTGERYWLMRYESWLTADLFYGNGGIIHFLMRYTAPASIGHPLDTN